MSRLGERAAPLRLLGLLALRVIVLGLSVGAVAVLARLLEAERLAVVFLVLRLVELVVLPSTGGLGEMLVRTAVRGDQEHHADVERATVPVLVVRSLVMSIAAGAVALLIAQLTPFIAARDLVAVAILVLARGLWELRAARWRTGNRVVAASTASSPQAISIMFAVLLLAIPRLRDAPVVVAFTLTAIIGIAAYAVTMPDARPAVSPASPNRKIWGGALLAFLLNRSDIILLGLLAGPGPEVAVYGVASRVAMGVQAPLGAVVQITPPIVAKMTADRRSPGELRAALRPYVNTSAAISLLLLLVVVVGRTAMAEVLAPGLEQSMLADVLVLVSLGVAVSSFAGPVGNVLVYAGHEHDVLRLTRIGVPVMLSAQVVGYYLGGVTGFAAAVAATMISLNLAALAIAHRRSGVVTVPSVEAPRGR